MSLLAFLTGMAGGADEAVGAERKRVQAEDDESLKYRREILAQMAKGAQDGTLNPQYAARAMKDYMEALQPGGGMKPQTGKRGFLGGKQAPNNDLLGDLIGGITQMLGPQGKDVNIQLPHEIGFDPNQMPQHPALSGISLPTLTGMSEEQPIPDQISAQRPADPFGGALYKHPDMAKNEMLLDKLLSEYQGGQIGNAVDLEKQIGLYGGRENLTEAMGNRYGAGGSIGTDRTYDAPDGSPVSIARGRNGQLYNTVTMKPITEAEFRTLRPHVQPRLFDAGFGTANWQTPSGPKGAPIPTVPKTTWTFVPSLGRMVSNQGTMQPVLPDYPVLNATEQAALNDTQRQAQDFIDAARKGAEAEGWNPGTDDAAATAWRAYMDRAVNAQSEGLYKTYLDASKAVRATKLQSRLPGPPDPTKPTAAEPSRDELITAAVAAGMGSKADVTADYNDPQGRTVLLNWYKKRSGTPIP